MSCVKQTWSKLGGQLGMGCVVLGILAIGLAWNGAAGVDFVQGQVPYLLSGGALGLGLVILGAAFIVVQNSRRDRSILEAQLRDLNTAITRLATAIGTGSGVAGGNGAPIAVVAEGHVVVNNSTFHRPDCRLIEGKDLPSISAPAALEQGLNACRICEPDFADVEPKTRARRRAKT